MGHIMKIQEQIRLINSCTATMFEALPKKHPMCVLKPHNQIQIIKNAGEVPPCFCYLHLYNLASKEAKALPEYCFYTF